MKNKLFVLTLALLMIVSAVPAVAIGMIGVENAKEISTMLDPTGEDAVLSSTTFPAQAPADAILYEDFETCTVTSSQTSFTYAADGYADAKVINGEQWITSLSEAPVSNGKSWYINTNNSSGGASITLSNLIFENTGKYKLSYKIYHDFESGAFGDLKYFVRVGNPNFSSPNFFDSKWVTDNTTKTWITKTYEFEVYEEDGTKYLKACDSNNYQAINTTTGAVNFRIYCYLSTKPTSETTAPVYFDDICIEYLSPVSANFADENGNAFEYDSASALGSVSVTMPTAENLGIAYEPKFTDENGNEYIPGEVVTITKNTTFTVSVSDIVLMEKFDAQELTTYKALLPVIYARDGFTGATIVNAKVYKTEYGTGNAYRQDIATSGTPTMANNISVEAPGVYTVSYDVGIEKDTYGKASDIQTWMRAAGNGTFDFWNSKKVISLDEPTASATISFEVYERASDGVLCFNIGSTEYLAADLTALRVAMVLSYPEGTADADKSTHYVFVDNFKVTYTPYAPETVKLASYRPENENETGGPAGIRFASYVTEAQTDASTEYGFVVTRKSHITVDGVANYELLNLSGVDAVAYDKTTAAVNSDNVKVVARAAYNGTTSRIYTDDGNNINSSYKGLFAEFFTGVLYGMSTNQQKSDVFVARPYIKVDGVYYYGECHEASYNDVFNKANA